MSVIQPHALLSHLKRAVAVLESAVPEEPLPQGTLEHVRSEVSAIVELLQQHVAPQPANIFEALVESVHDFGVFTLDCAGRVTTWNPGAERIFQFTEAEILDQFGDVIFTEEDRHVGAPEAERAQAARTGRADDKRWHRRKDGSRFWADGIVTPLRVEDSTVVGFVKVVRDATTQHLLETEREQLLQQLTAERELLATVLQQMPAGVAIAAAPSGQLLLHNDAAVRLLGHSMLPSETYEDYRQYGAVHVDGTPYTPQEYPIARAVHGETVELEEMQYRRGDDTLTTLLVNAAPVRDGQERVVAAVSTFFDIDGQKRNEEERRRLLRREQAARAEAEAAVQSRDAFLAIAAHELRTPLTVLSGNVQVLRRRLQRAGVADERLLAVAAAVDSQSRRLGQLIESLFDVSRLEMGATRLQHMPVELCGLTEQVIDELSPQLEHHAIHLTAKWCPALVLGDPLRLEQVLQNMLQNAVKYSPNGGQIEVVIEKTDGEIHWHVQDQGIGIPLAAQERLFERFYRAENAATLPISGLGIGLFVVHELVRLHGGRVAVASVEGQGTTFTVHLPASDSTIEATAEA